MICTWSIINNEMDYLRDVVEHHSWVDKMYFLDTGSTDGSLEYLKSIESDRIIVEKYHTSYVPEYNVAWENMVNPFPEIEVRNFALDQVEKLNPDWLIQLDGDEIFLSKTKSIIERNSTFSVISHSTINPVCSISEHPLEMRKGIRMHDPHARIWKAKQGFRYYQNPLQKKQFHCIPMFNGKHLYHHNLNIFIDDKIHFHLHWMYGKKVDSFFKGLNRQQIISKQTLNEFAAFVPKIFWNRREEWKNEHN